MSPEHGHNPAPPAQTPAQSGVEQDVSRVIADVESQLLRLKEAESQRRAFVAEMERREKALEQRQEALQEQARQASVALAEREAQVRELQARLDAKRAEWAEEQEQREERSKAREDEVRELQTRLDAQRAEWLADQQRQEERTRAREQETQAAQARLETRKAELAEAQRRIEAKADELRGLREHLEQNHQDQTGEIAQARAERDRLAGQLEEARAHIDRLAADLTQSKGQSTERLRSLEQDLEGLRSERDQLAASAQEHKATAEGLRSIELDLAALRTERDRLASALQAAQRAAGDQQGVLQQLEAITAERDRLTATLASAEQAAGNDEALLEQIKAITEERDRLVLELERRGSSSEDAETLSALRDQVEAMEHEREVLAAEVASLRSRSVSATGQARPMPPHRVESRMRRLKAVRNSVSARARKLRRAGEVLQQRVEQCDLLLQQRRELAAAKRAVDELHRRVQSAKVRNSTAVQICVWLVTLVTLAGLSWVVAGRYAPPSYAAKAVIAAEGLESGGQSGDPVAWSQFHVELLSHPRLIERVAARLQRRGMNDMATVDAVRGMIENALTHAEPEAGRIELELVAEGRLRTQRLLETYVTALVAEANESRPRRRDGLATIIRQEAAVQDEPVADPRPKYAGIGLAIAAGVAAMLWFGLWGAMSKVRARYEASSRLDEILDEARWVDPVPDVARRPGVMR